LHAIGIVHRNLNPENVMIDTDGHVIVSGLEFAKIVEQSGRVLENAVSVRGPKEYQAPELLLGWAHDFAVDCWGFGLLLHFMLSCAVSRIPNYFNLRSDFFFNCL
jgi:serine/threonine protein kinase